MSIVDVRWYQHQLEKVNPLSLCHPMRLAAEGAPREHALGTRFDARAHWHREATTPLGLQRVDGCQVRLVLVGECPTVVHRMSLEAPELS